MSLARLDSKLPDVQTTIFTVMSQMAMQHQALNLAQGFPDFSCPQRLKELVSEAMAQDLNQYAPMPGIPLLRERIAEKVQTLYGANVDMDQEITVTCGATEALFVAIQTLVRTGDEVVVFDPAYDSYEPAVQLAGGVCRHIPLTAPDYRIDWQRVGEVVNDKTRLLIINSPHNPTGSILHEDDLTALQALLQQHDFFVLSDEVYEHIIFDGYAHLSLLKDAEIRARSLVISSFGKTYHTTGWKVGYCIAPPALSAEFRKVHQYTTFSISTPFQHAIAHFMSDPTHHEELGAFYQHKRDVFRAGLADSAWELLPCHGTYFQLARYHNISNRGDVAMAEWMTKEQGVAAIPVSVFYQDGHDDRVLRFCFAKNDETLREGCGILQRIGAEAE